MRRRKTQPKVSHAHTFQLTPLSKSCTLQHTLVNFTPAKPPPAPSENQPTKANKHLRATISIVPRLNPDRKYYTACFVNPFVMDRGDDAQMLTSHENKVRESTLEIECDEILVPKPRKGATCYCCVCRCYYEDYLEHVESNYHREKLKEAPFSKDISELVKKVKQKALQGQENGVLTRAAKRRLQYVVEEHDFQDRPKKKIILSLSQQSGSARTEKADARTSSREELSGKREQSTLLKSEALIVE